MDTMSNFMYGNSVPGYSPAQLYAAAQAVHPDWIPLAVVGGIEYHGEIPGVRIKFMPPEGSGEWIPGKASNTVIEWVPLPFAGEAPQPLAAFSPPQSQQASVTTTDTMRTLVEIAAQMYGNMSQWEAVYDRNTDFMDAFGISKFSAGSFLLPVGIRIAI
jgi:hypothetical protein